MDKNKIIFYSICSSLLIGTLLVIFSLTQESDTPETTSAIFSTKKETSQTELNNQTPTTSNPTSPSSIPDSGWKNLNVSEDQVGKTLSSSAEIQNNVTNLRQLFLSGQDAEFEETVTKLVAENPGTVDYAALQADFYFSKRDYAKAEESIRSVLDLQPDNISVRTSLGEMLMIQGKTNEALDEFTHVFHQNPRYYDGIKGLLEAFQKTGEYQKGVRLVEQAFKTDPSNAAAARAYAMTLARQGKIENRDEVILTSIKSNPYDPNLLASASEIALRTGDATQAKNYGEQAFQYAKTRSEKNQALELLWSSAMKEKDLKTLELVIQRQKEMNLDPEMIAFNEKQLTEVR